MQNNLRNLYLIENSQNHQLKNTEFFVFLKFESYSYNAFISEPEPSFF